MSFTKSVAIISHQVFTRRVSRLQQIHQAVTKPVTQQHMKLSTSKPVYQTRIHVALTKPLTHKIIKLSVSELVPQIYQAVSKPATPSHQAFTQSSTTWNTSSYYRTNHTSSTPNTLSLIQLPCMKLNFSIRQFPLVSVNWWQLYSILSHKRYSI